MASSNSRRPTSPTWARTAADEDAERRFRHAPPKVARRFTQRCTLTRFRATLRPGNHEPYRPPKTPRRTGNGPMLQATINGVVLGGVYALVAIGFVVLFNNTQFFNFAHGD